MKKILSLIIISVLITLPLSISFAKAEDDWQSTEKNGFIFSAKLNFDDAKTKLKSIDMKIENTNDEDAIGSFPNLFDGNWFFEMYFYKDDTFIFGSGTSTGEQAEGHKTLHAGETLADTLDVESLYDMPLYDEIERKQKTFGEMIGDNYKVKMIAYIPEKNGHQDLVWLYSDVDLTKDKTEDPVVIDFRTAGDMTPIDEDTQPAKVNPNKTIPNPATGVEGISVAFITSIVALGTLLIASKKR